MTMNDNTTDTAACRGAESDAPPYVSPHSLDFEVAPPPLYSLALCDDGMPWMLYRVGTVDGQYRETQDAYEILSVRNSEPGNGHLDDLLGWFEFASGLSGKPLRIVCVLNERFGRHLVTARGFVPDGATDGHPDFIRRYSLASETPPRQAA